MVKIKTTLLLVITMTCSLSYAQTSKSNSQKIETLSKRIEVLESQKENLNKQTELLEKDFALKKTGLDTRFEENKIEIDKELSGLRNLMYTLGIGVLGLLLGYWIYFRKFIKTKSEEIAEEIINKRVANIVESNREQIINLINSQNIETKVKAESNILVITETLDDEEYLSNFFSEVGILNVSFESGEDFIQPSTNIDLVIFDDHNRRQTKHNLFNEYLSTITKEDMLFIFFGDRFEAIARERLNFANSKYTLYNQIINSLKYNEIRK